MRSIYEDDLPKELFTRTKQRFKRNLIDLIGKQTFLALYNEFVTKEIFEILNISKLFQNLIKNIPNSISFQLQWRLLVFSIWYKSNN